MFVALDPNYKVYGPAGNYDRDMWIPKSCTLAIIRKNKINKIFNVNRK